MLIHSFKSNNSSGSRLSRTELAISGLCTACNMHHATLAKLKVAGYRFNEIHDFKPSLSVQTELQCALCLSIDRHR